MFKVTRIDAGSYPAQFRTYAIGTYADFWEACRWAHGQAKAMAYSNNAEVYSTCYDGDGVATYTVEHRAGMNGTSRDCGVVTVERV